MRRLALVLFAGLALAPPLRALERPHVYLVVVDGLDPRFATRERMPRLFTLLEQEAERSSFFPAARAVLPSRTNPNHVTLVTGVHPDVHGITGNAYWGRAPDAPPEKLDRAELIEVETLFTVIETAAPSLRTLGAFGKPKLARLLGAAPGRQRGPDVLWSPENLPAAQRGRATGYASDAETMRGALGHMADTQPDFALVNLAGVDRTAHEHGPDAPECLGAVAAADDAIDRLTDDLRSRGRWSASVLIVTADHGFTTLVPTAERPYPVVAFGRELLRERIGGVRVVADGGIAHVYAEGLAAAATDLGPAAVTFARVADVARATPGIVEVVARLPGAGIPLLDAVHPDWHMSHERAGELLLVAAPGHQFVDPWDARAAALLGGHGGPAEAVVPLFVTGGSARLVAPRADAVPPALIDVAPTVARLLGLRDPRRLDGREVAAGTAGRPIAAVLRAQSPH